MSLRLSLFAALLSGLAANAAIDGTVINATTGMPQSGVTINLIHPSSENGMETLATAKSDAQGQFKLDKDLPPPPAILQSDYQGVQYNMVLPPGSQTSGVRVSVYDATSKAADASLALQHLIVLDPSAANIHVSETFLAQNTGKTTFSDPAKGSIQVYLPKEAQEGAKVTIQAPNGMPITRSPEKTSQSGVFKVGYPIKPGETQYNVDYTLPASQKFSGKVLGQAKTLIVTAESVKLSGDQLKDDGIKDLGQDGPRAHVYEVTAEPGAAYELGIEGTGTLEAGGGGESQPSEAEGGPPQPKAGPAKLYDRLGWVLALAFGILGLGGAVLYRKGSGPAQPAA